MVTSSKKPTTTPAPSPSPAKKPVAKKAAAATPASKPTTQKGAATAVKKTVPVAAKEAASTPVKKVIAPKIDKPASKPVETAKSAPAKNVKKKIVSPEDRYHMIATAAYFRAERRGFSGGYEMEDWIAGEAQIDAMLNA